MMTELDPAPTIGAVFGTLLALDQAWTIGRGLATGRWRATTGRVLAAEPYRPFRSFSEHLAIAYEYHVHGRPYRSSRVTFASALSGPYRRIWLLQRRLRPGKRLTVWYDPDNPEDAVLRRGVTLGHWVLFAVGTAVAALSLRALGL